MTEATQAALGVYLDGRARERTARIGFQWEALTARERRLVREAAVMGWVQGRMAHDAPVPRDRDIVGIVLSATDAMPDLYPTLSALGTVESAET